MLAYLELLFFLSNIELAYTNNLIEHPGSWSKVLINM